MKYDDWDNGHPELTDQQLQRAEIRAVEILAPLSLGSVVSPFRFSDIQTWLEVDDPAYEDDLRELEPDRDLGQYNGGSVAHPRVAQAMRELDADVEQKNQAILEDMGTFAPRADPMIELSDEELIGWEGWMSRAEPETEAEAAGWLARQIFEHHQRWDAPNPWHTLRPWQSDEVVDSLSREYKNGGRLGGWPSRGQSALMMLCCSLQYLPLWRAVKQVIFHHVHDGHYEQRHHWLLFVGTRHRFGGDGPFVVARGSLGRHRTTFTVGHALHSDCVEEGCFEIVGQYQDLPLAALVLSQFLPEGDARAEAATACAAWSGEDLPVDAPTSGVSK